MKAEYIKHVDGWVNDARLFKVDPPLQGNDFVIVSSSHNPKWITDPARTIIFPADENGFCFSYCPISINAAPKEQSHKAALKKIGYELEEISDEK